MLNGENGTGVDIFSCLKLKSGNNLLCVDQRKRKAGPVLPKLMIVSGGDVLFHLISGKKLIVFLACSVSCPASMVKPLISCITIHLSSAMIGLTNSMGASLQPALWLSQRFLYSEIVKISIAARWQDSKFEDLNDFKDFCLSQGSALSDEDEKRFVAYFRL